MPEDLHDEYTEMHWGDEPESIEETPISPQLERGVELGEVVSIVYRTSKGGELAEWEHDFEGELPKLVVDSETNRLHIVGGDYFVTERGIEG